MGFFKVEIIIEDTYVKQLADHMEKLGVRGYTAIEIFRGKGAKKGERLFHGMLPTTRTVLVFVICEKEVKDRLLSELKNYVDERHGIIFSVPVDSICGLDE